MQEKTPNKAHIKLKIRFESNVLSDVHGDEDNDHILNSANRIALNSVIPNQRMMETSRNNSGLN